MSFKYIMATYFSLADVQGLISYVLDFNIFIHLITLALLAKVAHITQSFS